MRLILILITILPFTAWTQRQAYDKVFFANSLMPGSYYYSSTSYQSPSWIKNVRNHLPVSDEQSYTPGNALELEYTSNRNGNWRAKIFYRQIRGVDQFTSATHLVMKMLVQSATTSGELPSVSVGNRRDSTMISSPVKLDQYLSAFRQNLWVDVRIPLEAFGSIDAGSINLIVFNQQSNDGKHHKLMIDQIELLDLRHAAAIRQIPKLLPATGFPRHIDIVWEPVKDTAVKYVIVERSINNTTFKPIAIQNPWIHRYADYTGNVGSPYTYRIAFISQDYKTGTYSNTVSSTTRSMSDEQLLDMIQEAQFRYYWEGAEANSGLALENIPGRHHMIAAGASGFGITALIAGTHRKFITRNQFVQRMQKIVQYLEKAEKFHGAFSHFLDGRTGKVEPFFGMRDNGGDLVETSFLIQGLIAAREYLVTGTTEEKNLAARIDKLWSGVEWSWYQREKDSKFLLWHWSPDQEWVINHKLIGWNETLITYFLAIASPSHAIPPLLYYSGWASQSEEAQQYRSNWGRTTEGSMYTNGKTYFGINLPVGVSNGGPLFFVHYSFLGLNPKSFSDRYTNYFDNNRRIALINYRYSIENPEKHQGYGPTAWGLTASDGLWGYSADEPVPHADNGKITPTGALASFPYTPEESMAALKNYYYNFGHFLWGEYGFRDAFNLDENWCSEIFMGLNQAPVVTMIENYRSGLIWKLFMQNKDVQKGLERIEAIR